jgi:diguanylate cyclase (GGDEF)-like protein
LQSADNKRFPADPRDVRSAGQGHGGGVDDSVDSALQDLSESTAERDDAASVTDQTASDADQTASDADQTAADSEQAASDEDQAASDQESVDGADQQIRDIGSRRREHATEIRDQQARARLRTAVARDITADERAQVATTRDQIAAARTAGARARGEAVESPGSARRAQRTLRAANDRQRAADDRARAADDRARAAEERAQSAHDRTLAARDRAQAALDREASETDELTHVRRRGAGMKQLQREVDRAHRAPEHLVVTFVDVDGLKRVNDTLGHLAGDSLLVAVAESLRQCLRSYDLIMRFGGDEFVCALPNADVEGVRERFDQVSETLAEGPAKASITVGFAELGEDDSAEDMIRRADADLYAHRAHAHP